MRSGSFAPHFHFLKHTDKPALRVLSRGNQKPERRLDPRKGRSGLDQPSLPDLLFISALEPESEDSTER
jgi:hypothetical protein